MNIRNTSHQSVQAAVSTWGSGSASYYTVDINKTESWGRTDSRGFLMAVQTGDTVRVYYVHANSSIVIKDHSVEDNGSPISPLNN